MIAPPVQLTMGHRRMFQETVVVFVDIALPRTIFDRSGIAVSPSRVETVASTVGEQDTQFKIVKASRLKLLHFFLQHDGYII